MKDNYDLNHYDKEYEKNDKVVYYIGDRDAPLRKLRNKWSGPWRVIEQIYPNTVIVKNDKNRLQFPAQLARLKKYHSREYWTLSQYEKLLKKGKVKDNWQILECYFYVSGGSCHEMTVI